MPGAENLEFWVATIISVFKANYKPAATQAPLIWVITGKGYFLIDWQRWLDTSNNFSFSSVLETAISFKSWPAEKTGPI